MRAYLSVFRLRLKLELQYRAAALGGFLTQLFFGFILVYLYRALYASGGQITSSLAQTASYVWLQQAFFRMLLSTDGDLVDTIMTGGMAYQMCRPVNQYFYWYVRDAAQRMTGSFLRAAPMLLVAVLLPEGIGLSAPASLLGLLTAFISLLLGLLCTCAVSNIVSAVTLRTLDRRGIAAAINLLQLTFSGNLLPLTLFPDRWQAIIRLTPFAQLLDAPIRLYTGQTLPARAFEIYGIQLFWVVALAALGYLLWSRNMKRLVVQGG